MVVPLADLDEFFEVTPHFAGHTYTSGHMSSGLSSLDPLFFLHHAGVDRGWYRWQDNCAAASGYTTKQCGIWGYEEVIGSSASGWPNSNAGASVSVLMTKVLL